MLYDEQRPNRLLSLHSKIVKLDSNILIVSLLQIIGLRTFNNFITLFNTNLDENIHERRIMY